MVPRSTPRAPRPGSLERFQQVIAALPASWYNARPIPPRLAEDVLEPWMLDASFDHSLLGVDTGPLERPKSPLPGGPLTWRQLSILGLAACGYRVQQIADELELSRNTVNTHIRAIGRKLGLTTQTEMVVCALRAGWL
jgi:DNA-binding NarL/FixJ family response regulator